MIQAASLSPAMNTPHNSFRLVQTAIDHFLSLVCSLFRMRTNAIILSNLMKVYSSNTADSVTDMIDLLNI